MFKLLNVLISIFIIYCILILYISVFFVLASFFPSFRDCNLSVDSFYYCFAAMFTFYKFSPEEYIFLRRKTNSQFMYSPFIQLLDSLAVGNTCY